MKLTFVTLRSVLFASVFLSLWAWVAVLARRLDGTPPVRALPPWAGGLGVGVFVLAVPLVVWCVGAFIIRGHGTPAPFDPPQRLVAVGPYRYVRNPMYVGGALLLLGFGLVQRSPSMVLLVLPWWLLFHLFVLGYEEPALHAKFGPDYDEYCRRTPRWLPRLRRAKHRNVVPHEP